MTRYAGEGFLITSDAKGYRGEALGPDEVQSVTVTILNKDKTVLHDAVAMTWNAEFSEWEYSWNTSGLEYGTYRYSITVLGVDGATSVEDFRVRLSRRRTVAVTA